MPVQNGPKLKTEERRSRVMQLKIAGATTRAIAEQLVVSPTTVQKDVRRRLDELAQADRDAGADDYRVLVSARYERLLMGSWTRAIAGEPDAVRNVIHILRAMREIHGLGIGPPGDGGDERDKFKGKVVTIEQYRRIVFNVGGDDDGDGAEGGTPALPGARLILEEGPGGGNGLPEAGRDDGGG